MSLFASTQNPPCICLLRDGAGAPCRWSHHGMHEQDKGCQACPIQNNAFRSASGWIIDPEKNKSLIFAQVGKRSCCIATKHTQVGQDVQHKMARSPSIPWATSECLPPKKKQYHPVSSVHPLRTHRQRCRRGEGRITRQCGADRGASAAEHGNVYVSCSERRREK